ncbi:MAG: sulfate adenylyltransferase subunit CysN, partial [Polyangiaceae bacterium]
RLLYESKVILEDQLAALTADSKAFGTQGGELDLALLVDGLAAEREQGITIDVAYLFFSTDKRKFIVADTPGHEQYTRNMATGASTADVAIILVDARKGVLTQTRRHSYIVSLLGIPRVVLAINKMDAVGFSQSTFQEILAEYTEFGRQIGLKDVVAIPMSALKGDNVTEPSANTPWYDGPTLMRHLESVEIDQDQHKAPFRMAVQWVSRPNQDFRGFAGLIASGVVRPGDRLKVLPSGKESRVVRIVTEDGDLPEAGAGQSITLTIEHEIDISRGDLLTGMDSQPAVAVELQATLIWMHEQPMLPGRPYLMKIGARTVTASVTALKHKVNVNTLEHLAATELDLNEIGVCNLTTDRPIAFDPYAENRDTGAFILIDKITNDTVGAGLIELALRRAVTLDGPARDVDKAARAAMKGQKACLVWLTGPASPKKLAVARLVEKRLHAAGRHTYLLDGDSVPHVAEVARMMVDAGLVVLVSAVSAQRSELVAEGEFVEVPADEDAAETILVRLDHVS